MAIDIEGLDTVEVGYDEFCGALAARDLQSLWSMQTQLMPNMPLPLTLPYLWKWRTVFPLAKRAGEIITIERGGDRRVLAFANPGLKGLPFTSSTLWGAIQYLGPGESAPAHRHTPSAVRFVMTGSGAFTTVDGDACLMEAGDLILTPNWNWHDHNNRGSEPMVWFDGLDLPLVTTLESIFFENHPDHTQEITGENRSEEIFGASGLQGRNTNTPAHSPLLRYSWANTDQALERMHRLEGGSSTTIEYRHVLTGGPVLPTLSCEMTRIRPLGRTDAHRKTGSSVYVVFRGTGQTTINGESFAWEAGDVFVTPSWAAVDHEVEETSDLFSISDRPVLEALHLYREAGLGAPQAIERVFTPR